VVVRFWRGVFADAFGWRQRFRGVGIGVFAVRFRAGGFL
jgi:hypothetical protein